MFRSVLIILLLGCMAGHAWGQQEALFFHIIKEVDRSSRPKPITKTATTKYPEYYEELPEALIGELKVAPQVPDGNGGGNIEPGQAGENAEEAVFRREIFEGPELDQENFGGSADQGR